jgi:LysM repeat protein
MVLARRTLAILVLVAIGVCPAAGDAKVGKTRKHKRTAAKTHVVSKGQTLWVIARAHGCEVRDITRANKLRSGRIIRPGQKLVIPECDSRGKRSKSSREPATDLIHHVASGDTLGRIAKRYDTSVAAIKKWNRLSSDMIRPGQELRVVPGSGGRGRPLKGQSIGSPHRGRLAHATQLPRSRGYYRRRPHRAYGTNSMVHHIRQMVSAVRGRYPRVHKLAIGDLSAKKGGFLAPHVSHQTGRDVDFGFYFKRRPKDYPKNFALANAKNLHFGATWTMLRTLCDTAKRDGGVEVIFLDYHLQKLLYEWARKRNVSKRTLSRMFQYPHGRGAKNGIIHHDTGGHDDHFHVRFKCPRGDKRCR